MYAYFIGNVTEINSESIVLETNNIGYNIIMPSRAIDGLLSGDEIKVYTYTAVREDAFLLYGFLNKSELEFFKLLLTVNGIGPKAAITIMSNSSVDDLQVAIIAQDIKALSKLPGIGSKTAGRIILDLKDKIHVEDIIDNAVSSSKKSESSGINRIKKEASDILSALGISASDSMRALNKLEITEESNVEDIVSMALRQM